MGSFQSSPPWSLRLSAYPEVLRVTGCETRACGGVDISLAGGWIEVACIVAMTAPIGPPCPLSRPDPSGWPGLITKQTGGLLSKLAHGRGPGLARRVGAAAVLASAWSVLLRPSSAWYSHST